MLIALDLDHSYHISYKGGLRFDMVNRYPEGQTSGNKYWHANFFLTSNKVSAEAGETRDEVLIGSINTMDWINDNPSNLTASEKTASQAANAENLRKWKTILAKVKHDRFQNNDGFFNLCRWRDNNAVTSPVDSRIAAVFKREIAYFFKTPVSQ